MFNKFIKISISFVLLVFLYIAYVYISTYKELHHKVVNYNSQFTTQVFDSKGDLIANLFKNKHRLFVSYKEIPTQIIETLISTEDTSFFEHKGINPEAIFRALIKDISAGSFVEGASTITQQLVKISLLSRKKTISRKIKEVILSFQLEAALSKEQILERYLNEVYFGHGYYGIKTAANGYFHKKLNNLSRKEIAILIGLPKAPSAYNPIKHYDRAINRANQVLYRLKKLGWIDSLTYANAIKEKPIVFNDTLTKNKAPYVIDYMQYILKDKISDLKTGGYKIKLSIDLSLQKIARDALRYGYNKIKERDIDNNYTQTLNGAIVSIDNATGDILALVGGVEFNTSQFNRVTQAIRQPGSSVKPFIYQAALDNGYGTNTKIADIVRSYDYQKNDENLTWRPRNYENNIKGMISLRDSLVHSRNLATINLVNDLGLRTVYNTLKKYGFNNIPRDLSISLGSFGITPLELSRLYTVFSNYGVLTKPILVKEVSRRGYESATFAPVRRRVLSKKQAFLGLSILKEVVRRGTGYRTRMRDLQLAGKTGTTNNNQDVWFCGFSPSIQTVVWYGNDNSKKIGEKETGGKSAAPAFKYFYEQVLKIYPHIKRTFDVPEGVSKKGNYYFTDKSPLEEKSNKLQNEIFF